MSISWTRRIANVPRSLEGLVRTCVKCKRSKPLLGGTRDRLNRFSCKDCR